jgi:hypothetical protein
MGLNMVRGLIVLVVSLALAACTVKPEVNAGGPVKIIAVQTSGNGLPGQLEDLQQKTMNLAARVPKGGDMVVLRLQIENYHLKNPGMSLVVGDANRMTVDVQVVAQNSEAVISRFKTVSSVDNYLNGPIGAVIAATANKEKVMYQLNSKAADDILERIYGTKVWKTLGRR